MDFLNFKTRVRGPVLILESERQKHPTDTDTDTEQLPSSKKLLFKRIISAELG